MTPDREPGGVRRRVVVTFPLDIEIGEVRLVDGQPVEPTRTETQVERGLGHRTDKTDGTKGKTRSSGVMPKDAVSGLQGVKMRTLNPTPSGDDADYEAITKRGRTEGAICETLNERNISPLQMAEALLARDDGISQALAHNHITQNDVEGMEFEVAYALLPLYPEDSRPRWEKVLKDEQEKRSKDTRKL